MATYTIKGDPDDPNDRYTEELKSALRTAREAEDLTTEEAFIRDQVKTEGGER